MNINLAGADAAIGIAFDVISEYLQELTRLGKLPSTVEFDKDFGGQNYHVIVRLDPFVFKMATDGPDAPRSILKLTGVIEARPVSDPTADPLTLPLDAAVKLTVILKPGDPVPVVGFRYDGVDGTPAFPVTAADIDNLMQDPSVQDVLTNTSLPLAENLVKGLNESRFPEPATRPAENAWDVQLTLTPATDETIDAFIISAAPPGSSAIPSVTESFVAPRIGLAVAYNRTFLDLMLALGAGAKVGQTIDGAKVTRLSMKMANSGISISGHVVRDIDTPIIDLAPDVDIDFDGIAIPELIRGTTGMTMDTSGLDVDVDDSDEIFYGALAWVLTIGSSALLFTGVGTLTAIGIASWVTLVQYAWNGEVELDNAPNVLRDNLGASLGAQLSLLADSLDDSTDAGELTVESTPDSAIVSNGHLILYAQVIIKPMMARLRSAEYSHHFRRFVVYELDDRRRFRAQELARLMKAGKITVSGFHHVNGKYIRSDHDNSAANNLLKLFKGNETEELVVKNQ